MGIVKIILAILVGLFVLGGIAASFEVQGKEQIKIMAFTTILILFEAWLIGG